MTQTRSPWIIFISMLIGVFVLLEAAAFQAPALPFITEDFGIKTSFAGAVTLAYYAAAIVFAPMMGRLGDQIGRKEMIVIGLTVFSLSEFVAALSPNFTVFLIARFIQGIGYACVFPTVFAYISELFDEAKRGKAVGLLGATATVGAASGGIIAGFLIDLYGWSIIYWVSGTLSAIGVVIVLVVLPKTLVRKRQQIDYAGGFALLIAICSLISLPILVGNFGWSSLITILAIVGAIVGLTLLVLIERKVLEPVIDITILRLRGIHVPALIVVIQNFCNICLIYALSFYVASRVGWGATEVGLVSTLSYLFNSVATISTGFLVDRYNPKYFVLIGGVGTLTGAFFYSMIDMNSTFLYIILSMGTVGFFNGMTNPALMKIVITDVPSEKKGAGTGTFVMFRDLGVPLGSTFGLALFGVMKERQMLQTTNEAQATASALGSVGVVVMGFVVVLIIVSLLLFRRPKSSHVLLDRQRLERDQSGLNIEGS